MANETLTKYAPTDLTGRIERIDDQAIVFCNELPLGGCGATPEEALRNFLESLTAYLDAAEADGSLRQILSEYGLLREPPSIKGIGNFSLRMPWEMPGPSSKLAGATP